MTDQTKCKLCGLDDGHFVNCPNNNSPLEHGMNCSAFNRPPDAGDPDCTCGLYWRIALQTEQTMHVAWRKRAEESEIETRQHAALLAECVAVMDKYEPSHTGDCDYWAVESGGRRCTCGLDQTLAALKARIAALKGEG